MKQFAVVVYRYPSKINVADFILPRSNFPPPSMVDLDFKELAMNFAHNVFLNSSVYKVQVWDIHQCGSPGPGKPGLLLELG
jgi:hypothetical protein